MATHLAVSASAAADTTMALNRLWSVEADTVRTFWRHVERYAVGSSVPGRLRSGAHQAIVVSGWGCEMCILPDGRRQIFSLALPGDLVSLPDGSEASLRTFVALTPLELMDPRLVPGWHAEDEDVACRSRKEAEARLLHHVVRLGQLTGYERMLHLFLELHARLGAVGLVKNGSFRLPLTQEVLADVLGLSLVHLSRTLQQLRRDQLITVKGRIFTLHRVSELRALALYQGVGEAPSLPC